MAETVAVLVEKVRVLEREMREVKNELRTHIAKNSEEHDELNDDIAAAANSIGRVELMFTHLKTTNENMDKKIDEIAKSAGKDQGWRALLTDLIRGAVLIGGLIASGKFWL
ncbi:hypothetical protein M4D55_23500 [Metabacillus idriensis]|uniref:hypothetical protein n=1 Tax=Metabacillus idriensis TaxID=324768 RepID=UPI002040105E|nr:hypothetical protein [Metabacillus idriensis]MCM3598729.1 hypothetical protein [Metabacillus idriensis]